MAFCVIVCDKGAVGLLFRLMNHGQEHRIEPYWTTGRISVRAKGGPCMWSMGFRNLKVGVLLANEIASWIRFSALCCVPILCSYAYIYKYRNDECIYKKYVFTYVHLYMYKYVHVYVEVGHWRHARCGNLLQVEVLERGVNIREEPYASRIMTRKGELEEEHGLVWP